MIGVKLIQRMRGLSDAAFYRPDKFPRFQHIDALFGDEINWDLIATRTQYLVLEEAMSHFHLPMELSATFEVAKQDWCVQPTFIGQPNPKSSEELTS